MKYKSTWGHVRHGGPQESDQERAKEKEYENMLEGISPSSGYKEVQPGFVYKDVVAMRLYRLLFDICAFGIVMWEPRITYLYAYVHFFTPQAIRWPRRLDRVSHASNILVWPCKSHGGL